MRDLESECRRYELECGEVHTRMATPEELKKYRERAKKKGELYDRDKSTAKHGE